MSSNIKNKGKGKGKSKSKSKGKVKKVVDGTTKIQAAKTEDSKEIDDELIKKKQEVIAKYRTMRRHIQRIAEKLHDLDNERKEYSRVARTLKQVDGERRCFRSIGGVLVERTVGEVLPAVETNLSGIHQIIQKLTAQLREKEKESDEYRALYNIGLAEGRTESKTERKKGSGSNSVLADVN